VRDTRWRIAVGGLTRHHDVETGALVREHVDPSAAAAEVSGRGPPRHAGRFPRHGDPASDLPAVVLARAAASSCAARWRTR
jgi:hypothetical protein